MKKFVMLTVSVALIAFFAMPKAASAAAQIIFSGDYQVVGIASDNVSDRNKDTNDHAAYVEQRFRLTHIAAVENVKGVFGIEIGWDEWGKSYSYQGAGQTLGAGGDSGMIGDTPSTNMEVRMAYIEFNVPGMPLTVTAGKQPLMTHNHAILSSAAFSPGLKFDYKIAEGSKLSLWWAKTAEGTVSSSTLRGNGDADSDMYTLEFSQKTKSYDFGVYGVYAADHRENDVAAGTTSTTATAMSYKDDIYWTGMWAGFMAGPAKLGVDAIYSFGKRDRSYTGETNQDYNGYLLRVDGSVNMGGPTLDFMSVYASGDNDSTDNKINNFAYVDASARYPTLGLLLPGPNLLYWGNGIATEEYAQICLPVSGYSAYDSGYSLGRWFTMVGATMPVDKLKLVAKYWYLQTTEKFPSAYNYRTKEIGHEVDLEAHYQMTPNLTLSVEGDYLFAGNYFKTNPSPETTKSPDNAWKLAWAIKLVF
jgi:hypothetical protein